MDESSDVEERRFSAASESRMKVGFSSSSRLRPSTAL
jgi:hypothetical protein